MNANIRVLKHAGLTQLDLVIVMSQSVFSGTRPDEVWSGADWWIARQFQLQPTQEHAWVLDHFSNTERTHFHLMQRLQNLYELLWNQSREVASKYGLSHKENEPVFAQFLYEHRRVLSVLDHVVSEMKEIHNWFKGLHDHREKNGWQDERALRNNDLYDSIIADGVEILADELGRCVDESGAIPQGSVVRKYGSLLPRREVLRDQPQLNQVKRNAVAKWYVGGPHPRTFSFDDPEKYAGEPALHSYRVLYPWLVDSAWWKQACRKRLVLHEALPDPPEPRIIQGRLSDSKVREKVSELIARVVRLSKICEQPVPSDIEDTLEWENALQDACSNLRGDNMDQAKECLSSLQDMGPQLTAIL